MSQSIDPDQFFQTDDAIAKRERRAKKAKGSTQGQPISLSSKPLALCIDPTDSTNVYVALSEGEARKISLETRALSLPFRRPKVSGPITPLTSLAILSGREKGTPPLLFAGSWSAQIYAWDANTRELRYILDGGHNDFVKTLLLFSLSVHVEKSASSQVSSQRHRTLLASAGADTHIVLWDVDESHRGQGSQVKPIATLTGHSRSVLALAADPYAQEHEAVLFSASSDREVKRWRVQGITAGTDSIQTNEHTTSEAKSTADSNVFAVADPFAVPLLPHHTTVTTLAFAPGGDLWTGSADGSAICLSRPDDEEGGKSGSEEAAWTPDTTLMHGDNNPVRALAISPDGRLIVTGCRDEDLWVWDAALGEVLGKFVGHADEITAVVFASLGNGGVALSNSHGTAANRLVSASLDGTVRTWILSELGKEKVRDEATEKEEKGGGPQLTAEEEAELASLMEED